jgi:hypothetical protein
MEGRALSLLLAPSAKPKPQRERQPAPNREQAAAPNGQQEQPPPAPDDSQAADDADADKEE